MTEMISLIGDTIGRDSRSLNIARVASRLLALGWHRKATSAETIYQIQDKIAKNILIAKKTPIASGVHDNL
jgi:hypothetical protein